MTVIGTQARTSFGRTSVTLGWLGVGAGTQSNRDGERAFDEMLEAAWQHGVRDFDTAPLYLSGESERRLGRFVRRHERNELVISTKVGRLPNRPEAVDLHSARQFDFSASATRESVSRSLERLGTDRVDIVYAHDVDREMHGDQFDDVLALVLDECLPTLAQLRDEGMIRAIGVSSRQPDVCLSIARNAAVDGFIMAGSYTLLNHEPLHELLPYCLESGHSVVIASPFNTGILATGDPDATYDYGKPTPEVQNRVARIVDLCRVHDVDLAAAALTYPVRHPAVAAVVVGNRSAAEVRRNIAIAGRPIPDDFWADLEAAGLTPSNSQKRTS
ncbi:D-threo-aldose 1-dehydrogenase [Amycolatopsis bartoniae]|uniref:aldo/keto reductase n=1 Tax=Amycolatopsis bartoniae TaxID=941986 RepID=UPI00160566C8|nr:aldo/keto reductase [Amycolatopsis bartoniae]MBB2939420.1 D-threo-aldose 1-dehydrogenase [Amycolatopsis bartoniae]